MPVVTGALLVLAGCGGIGFMAFWRLERRVRLLAAFSLLSERLACEIGFRLTPLPELPERIPALKVFWDTMDYRPYGSETFAEAWARAAEVLDVSEIDRALICEMGNLLGRYDADSQARTLGVLRGQLEMSLALARENRQKYGRLYGMLGLLGGFLLVVILL